MNIRQVGKKIKSVNNVKKITKAMEMVSAIKMRKSQLAAVEGRPYQENLELIIKEVTGKVDPKLSDLLKTSVEAVDRELAIVISTNKGLCGSFNFNLFRFLVKNSDIKNTDYIVIGKKVALFLNKLGASIQADFSSSAPINSVSAVFDLALTGFLQKKYSRVSIYYHQFISTLKSEPIKVIILPVVYKTDDKAVGPIEKSEYLIEPSPQEIIDQLLKSYVEEKIRNAFIQSEAGEHSSRMIAMKNATENANDVSYNLTLLRNKIRQEKITNELLDMMTATESVG